MKSDGYVLDPQERPISPKARGDAEAPGKAPSRFRRKKRFDGATAMICNENFRSMPGRF